MCTIKGDKKNLNIEVESLLLLIILNFLLSLGGNKRYKNCQVCFPLHCSFKASAATAVRVRCIFHYGVFKMIYLLSKKLTTKNEKTLQFQILFSTENISYI